VITYSNSLVLSASWEAVFFLAVLGLVVGSFLNVLILRLPVMMTRVWEQEMRNFIAQKNDQDIGLNEKNALPSYNLFLPRSHCPHCLNVIPAIELVPVLSWICLRGRCAQCKGRISLRYPLIELMTAGLSGAVGFCWGVSPTAFAALAFIWALIALTFIDIDTLFLPDTLTQPLLWLGLIVNAWGGFVSFELAFWGAVWGYLSLWILYWLFRLSTGKEGIGQGDFKLLAALGAWLGWQSVPALLLFASLAGAGYGLLGMILAGFTRQTPIPFGPFLALSGLIMLFFPFLSGVLVS
jgi:leader peptidase (prepilin peptidase)/N-methyltransferase